MGIPRVALYGATLFLSAFLLFWVQPLLGKFILPWFGGTPAVWNSCMLFFQVLLLGGYSYAHLLANIRSAKRQWIFHLLVLGVSLCLLPILPSEHWKPGADTLPIPRILVLLAASVGAPFLLLSSSSPLLQAWFSRRRRGVSPYRLYAVSNAGCLLAIIVYPFLLDPLVAVRDQARIWSWGYGAFVLMSGLCALGLPRMEDPETAGKPGPDPDMLPGPPGSRRILWLLLPCCSSIVLLSTTNQLCADVPAVPVLWVLPLGLYLVSFILCFARPRWYSRLLFGGLLAGSLAWTSVVLLKGVFASIGTQIASSSLMLLAACMVCHGELVRTRPVVRHLTAFYGMVAAGSALGGVFVTCLAPLLFVGVWEFHVGMLAAAVLFLLSVFLDGAGPLGRGRVPIAWVLLCGGVVALVLTLGVHVQLTATGNLDTVRNFFGVVRVFEEEAGDPRFHRVTMMHGRIQHGFQYKAPFRRDWPTSYYGAGSGAGLALRCYPRRGKAPKEPGGLRIGVVGLGTGTLATYAQPGDSIRFYEINPEVVRLAGRYFSYLKDCRGRVEIVPGDARISLERERARGEIQQFDVLAVDAFSSDAVPVHLLTRECAAVYRAHMKPGGILALHVSSRYFDLTPVARSLASPAAEAGTEAVLVSCASSVSEGVNASDWVLVTANREFLDTAEVQASIRPWTKEDIAPAPWTDDHSNLYRLLRRKK